jgi:hypothetical protein
MADRERTQTQCFYNFDGWPNREVALSLISFPLMTETGRVLIIPSTICQSKHTPRSKQTTCVPYFRQLISLCTRQLVITEPQCFATITRDDVRQDESNYQSDDPLLIRQTFPHFETNLTREIQNDEIEIIATQ